MRFFAKKTLFFTKKGYYAPINFERYVILLGLGCSVMAFWGFAV